MNINQNIETMSIEELQKRCVQLERENAELTAKLNWLMEQLRLNKRRQFGVSSERTAPEQQQLSFLMRRRRKLNQIWPSRPWR